MISNMSTFTLAISCLTTFNLSWFMNLTFQVPMQYCSLQHQTLLLSPVTSTAGCCYCFGSVSSIFLELFLHWSPVAYWAPNDLGSSSFSILLFCLFILFMGYSRQEYWSGLPFPSQVDHILSYTILLIYVNETLYGNLPFFKIQVNRFMAWDDSPGAILWVLRHFLSLISRLLVAV